MSAPRAAPRRRMFFALWLDAHASRTLAGAIAGLRVAGRRVPDAGLHMTLVFLGALAGDEVRAAERAAHGVDAEAFDLELARVGHWPRARVLWAAAEAAPAALYALQGRLAGALRAAGFADDGRAFAPHVTVARKVARYRGPARIAPVVWSVREFLLVESRTLPEGASYRPVRAFGLRAPA